MKKIVGAALAGAFTATLVASPSVASHRVPSAGSASKVPTETARVALATSETPEKKLVVARVTGRVSKGTVKRVMFHITLTCDGQHIKATQNAMRGQKVTLVARKIMDNPSNCYVRVSSALGAHTSDFITTVSSITFYNISFGAQDESPTLEPYRLNRGKYMTAAAARIEVPAGPSYVNAFGSVKLTSCNTLNGSSENGSPQKCSGFVREKTTVKAEIRLIGEQYNDLGQICRSVVISRKVVKINRYLHHLTTHLQGTLKRSGGSCGGDLRVRLFVKTLGKTSVVVHRGGTIVGGYR